MKNHSVAVAVHSELLPHAVEEPGNFAVYSSKRSQFKAGEALTHRAARDGFHGAGRCFVCNDGDSAWDLPRSSLLAEVPEEGSWFGEA